MTIIPIESRIGFIQWLARQTECFDIKTDKDGDLYLICPDINDIPGATWIMLDADMIKHAVVINHYYPLLLQRAIEGLQAKNILINLDYSIEKNNWQWRLSMLQPSDEEYPTADAAKEAALWFVYRGEGK